MGEFPTDPGLRGNAFVRSIDQSNEMVYLHVCLELDVVNEHEHDRQR